MCRSLIFILGALALTACSGGPSGRAKDAPALQTVSAVDAEQYVGLWYEIARYPNGFQENCEGVTAEYALRDDGKISVLNTCHTGTKSGEPRSARGVARILEGSNGARLAVNFAPIPLPAGDGNYWVIYLDDAYQQAVVGEPSGRYLWYLSRTPAITPDVRVLMDAAAAGQGYDLSMLKETIQK